MAKEIPIPIKYKISTAETVMDYLQTGAMIAELKKRGLGVYPLKLSFINKPKKDADQV